MERGFPIGLEPRRKRSKFTNEFIFGECGSATPPSQNMGNTPAGVDSACVSPEKDEHGGKLSSSNMIEQLAKTYQGKPSSPSGMSH